MECFGHSCRTRPSLTKVLRLLVALACPINAQSPPNSGGIGFVDDLGLTDGKFLSARGWAIGKNLQTRVRSLRFYVSHDGTAPRLIYEDTPLAVPRPDVIQALQRPGLEKSHPGWALPLSRLYGKLRPGLYLFSVKAVMTDGEVISLSFSGPAAAEVIVP